MSPRALARGLLVGEAVLLPAAPLLALPHVQAVPPALAAVPILAYGWLGARTAERAPRNRIGWLLSAAASSAAPFLFLRSYTYFGIEHGASPLPLTRPPPRLLVLLPPPGTAGRGARPSRGAHPPVRLPVEAGDGRRRRARAARAGMDPERYVVGRGGGWGGRALHPRRARGARAAHIPHKER